MPVPESGLEKYLVGGAVRDRLLGLPVTDRDWVVIGTTAEELRKRGFLPVGKDFPVFLHPETREQYALARTERKTGAGYRGFVVDAHPGVTLYEDLQRRDLTINAMAEADDGTLIDPFGGRADIRERLLRHVSPAFAEDPVRVLRVARFAARYADRGFSIAAGTLALMRQLVDHGEVDALVPERVWAELERALGEPAPSAFVEALRACGALARLMPEIEALFGVPQPPAVHPEIDTGVHTLLVVDQAARLSPETTVRFAALVHDLGKALTPSEQWPRHRGHEQTGLAPIEALCARLRAPNAFRELALLVCRHHLKMHQLADLRPATVYALLSALDAFRRPPRLRAFALACEADARGRLGCEDIDYPQGELLRRMAAAAAAVDGRRAAADGATGKALGEEIRRRRIAAIAAVQATPAERGR